jgi:hypothetical protein
MLGKIILHLFLIFITSGLWLIVLFIMLVMNSKKK